MLTLSNLLLLTLVFAFVHGTSHEDFRNLVKDYWAWRLEDAPEFATQIQVHTYDDKVENYTIGVLDDRKRRVDEYLQRVDKIDISQLDTTERVSYEVLKDTLQTYQQGYKWKNYGPMNPVNFMDGLWTNPRTKLPFEPKTYDDFMNFTARISGWGDQALDMMSRMERAINESTTSNWVSMNGSLIQLDDLIGDSDIDNIFYEPFNETLDNTSMSEEDKKHIRSAALSAVKHLRESYSILKNFITTKYKDNARTAFGVNSFKDGIEYYKACLKWHLSEERDPEDIHALGLREVDRIYREMNKILDKLKFNGTVKDFFVSLNKNPKFFLKTPQETIKRFEDIIFNRIQPKLLQYFKNIPDMPVKVEEMPTDGPTGSYTFGSPDGSRPGIFYANVRRPEDNPTYVMVALALHEADPGHHLQDIYSQASKGLDTFLKVSDDTKYFSPPLLFPLYTAHAEGWALYAESLGEELYIYQDEYELMGRYSFEIFRACRLVVDSGLHYYNWTRERAVEYMSNYTAESEPAINNEIDRYITFPGQACAYKVGELKIRELRTRAETQLGNKFNIRDFHSVVLENGLVPLKVLEQLVDTWIANRKDNFDKIMSDYYAWRLKSSPEFATYYTYKYNDQLESFDYKTLDTQQTEAKDFLNRLVAVGTSTLDAETLISYRVLKNMLNTFIDGYKWHTYGPLNPFSFLNSWFDDIASFTSGTPFDTKGDFVNYIRRLELTPKQIGEMIELSRKAIQLGHTNNNGSMLRMLGPLVKAISLLQDPTNSPLYKPFNGTGESMFGNESVSIGKRLLVAINLMRGTIINLKSFLETEYMPNTRKGFGVGSLPNGTDLYRDCLKWHTSLDMSPTEVHEKGLEEMQRISELMKQAMHRLGFPEGTAIKDVYHNLTNNPELLLQTGEEMLERYRQIIFERIHPKISKYFKDAPNLPLEVRPSRSDGIGGSYLSGSADGSRPGIFHANVRRPEDNPTYTMVSLSLHEAIPGHHLAESYSAVSDLPSFRKHMQWRAYSAPYYFPFFNSYVEGWALYSEYLGEEMGIYQDDNELMGRYSDEMLRAVRLVVDTGIHYYDWNRTYAIDYMLTYTAESPESAAIEIDRYSTWPGQACGYKLGEIKIKEIRKRAEAILGDKFVLRDFHYTILKSGPMPLNILEEVVDEWTNSVVASQSTSAPPACSTIKTSGSKTYMASNIGVLIALYITSLLL